MYSEMSGGDLLINTPQRKFLRPTAPPSLEVDEEVESYMKRKTSFNEQNVMGLNLSAYEELKPPKELR